jgi:hypothetical protein
MCLFSLYSRGPTWVQRDSAANSLSLVVLLCPWRRSRRPPLVFLPVSHVNSTWCTGNSTFRDLLPFFVLLMLAPWLLPTLQRVNIARSWQVF